MIFEKIREMLEDAKDSVPVNRLLDNIIKDKPKELGQLMAYDDAIDIINQVEAEYNNGWIHCSERLPEESGEYLTWVRYDGNEFRAIDEIDCDGMTKKWNCSFEYEVIAWQPLPQPPKGE